MKIAVLGTGPVGRALAGRLAELDHAVTLGTRDPEATLARGEAADWAAAHPAVAVAAFADAAAGAELVLNATSGEHSLAALEAAGAANLAGKVLLDVANLLVFAEGALPAVGADETDSLAERIQRAFPEARVVKSLNTMNGAVMADPRSLADGDHTVFVSGDDADAKAVVTGLLRGMGHTDVLDLGALDTARGAELAVAFWIRVRMAVGHDRFNFKIVR